MRYWLELRIGFGNWIRWRQRKLIGMKFEKINFPSARIQDVLDGTPKWQSQPGHSSIWQYYTDNAMLGKYLGNFNLCVYTINELGWSWSRLQIMWIMSTDIRKVKCMQKYTKLMQGSWSSTSPVSSYFQDYQGPHLHYDHEAMRPMH